MNLLSEASSIGGSRRSRLILINLGSLFAQVVQVAGYPTLLALALARVDYPSWLIGAVLACQWAVVLISAPLVPKLMDRIGLQTTSQTGSIISAASLAVLLFSSSATAVVTSALLMGVGLTIRWVACDTWIVQAVEERSRGRAIGIHETLMGLGIAIGPLLTMLSDGNETAALLAYVTLMALSVACFAFGSPVANDRDSGEEGRGGLFGLVLRLLVLALVAALAAGYVETAIVSLLPLYLISFHYPEAQSLALLSVFGLGGTVLQTPLGWIADKWSFRAAQILCILLIITGGLLLIAMIGSLWAVAAILFVWGGCIGGLNTLAVIEAGSTLRGSASGTGMALIASSYTLGGVIGPIVSGATLSLASGHGAILTIITIMLAYAIALLAAGRK
ncbi:putative membrane protein [Brucella sp. 10RB9215]|uniref:MFS transporter n=2 Tax=unclassified Brucella TaxID=2632610 RepID=UPI00090A38E3|nr:MFS transporter [Brucella sp. 10RB9215]SBW16154.1 putative membrane protein [Brucella sp. 10RB9215]